MNFVGWNVVYTQFEPGLGKANPLKGKICKLTLVQQSCYILNLIDML